MKNYRKKPVVIQAIQFDGSNSGEILAAIGNAQDATRMFESGSNDPILVIHTLEGSMTVSKNDWVIKGVKGEYYPCKPDIFEATYEAEVSV